MAVWLTTDEIWKIWKKIQEKRPLVHCITNIVTVNDCANILLAAGASPIMAHHPLESAQIQAGCRSLVCNLGATESWEAMWAAGKKACELGHPIILDPVGAAASDYRREQCFSLIEGLKPTCIRGNYSEIRALVLRRSTAGGVDAEWEEQSREEQNASVEEQGIFVEEQGTFAEEQGIFVEEQGISVEEQSIIMGEQSASIRERNASMGEMVRELAARYQTMVIASGKTDWISDGSRICRVENGSTWMGKLTGTGCMSSSLLGAFLGAEETLNSAASACILMGICGQTAEIRTRKQQGGLGTFHIQLLDSVSMLQKKNLGIADFA
ncbi:MAG: hydroxyethylthiazole kinase [Lachnospiraceae bacterium]|nr:hydroxyethylthiazole kinase [Lachnospiraceae bacterium]